MNRRILYGYKYLEDCLYTCFDSSSKKWPWLFDNIVQNNKFYDWNKPKSYEKGRPYFNTNFLRNEKQRISTVGGNNVRSKLEITSNAILLEWKNQSEK